MKILHTADIHIGSNAHGRLDAATGLNSSLLDFRRSFEFMAARALEEDIDLFLFCGDAYRNADPDPTEQKLFAECLKPIADRGIPIVMIVGNHDHPVAFGRASSIDIFGYLTGKVYIFSLPEVQTIPTKSGPLQLVAVPWPIRSRLLAREEYRKKTPAEIRDLIEAIYVDFVERAAQSLDPALPAVLAAHLTVQGAELSGSERTSHIEREPVFSVGQLARPPIDYVALGHIHRFQDRNPEASPPVVYSSSIERINFKEWDDRKGFVLVNITADGGKKRTAYEFVETPARRFLPFQIDARGAADPNETILKALEKQSLDDAIVRVRYHIDEAQAPLIDLRRIREALKPAFSIAAIERTVDPVERQRRNVVERDATLKEAMLQYIGQHEHLAPMKDDLLRAALELEAEYEAQQRSQT